MIRFGVIGTNWISETFLNALNSLSDVSLTAVYSRSQEKADSFAEEWGATHTFTNLEEMAKSDTFDAVYIASPNSLHASQAILMMNGGKHVLVEKAAASNVHEWNAMTDVARRNNVTLMEALKGGFMPNFKLVQENMEKIGPIRRVTFSLCQYSSRYDAYKEGKIPNAFNPVFSNGALMDIGIYCIYPLVLLFGKPLKVQANALFLKSGVDGQGAILMSYESMDAVIYYSKIANSSLSSEIQGEEGNILIRHISQPSLVELQYRKGQIENLTRPQVENTMVYEIEEFVDLIRKGKVESSINSFQVSRTIHTILDDVRKQIGLVFPADQLF